MVPEFIITYAKASTCRASSVATFGRHFIRTAEAAFIQHPEILNPAITEANRELLRIDALRRFRFGAGPQSGIRVTSFLISRSSTTPPGPATNLPSTSEIKVDLFKASGCARVSTIFQHHFRRWCNTGTMARSVRDQTAA
jgi:hypothetical protein